MDFTLLTGRWGVNPTRLQSTRVWSSGWRANRAQRERERERKTGTMSGAGAPDFFCREAQRLGYVARSAFKVPSLFSLSSLLIRKHNLTSAFPFSSQLLQMQKQYKLITPGALVLDLGCAPGAWLQVPFPSIRLKNSLLIHVFFAKSDA